MRILETIIQWSHCNAGEEGSSKGADPSRLRGGVGGVGGVVIFMQYKDAVGDDSIPPSGVDCRRRQDAQLLPTDSQ